MHHVLFSDVQGNLPALEAVLDAAKRHRATEVVSLGNALGLGPHTADVVHLLRKRRVTCLAGPHEAWLSGAHEGPVPDELAHNLQALDARDARYLRGFAPARRITVGGRRCHVAWTPWTADLEPVAPDADARTLEDAVAKAGADVAVWGSAPGPGVHGLPGGGWVAAPGRAGLHPEGPEAPYALLDVDAGTAEVRTAPYDGERFVRDMLKHELPLTGVPEALRHG